MSSCCFPPGGVLTRTERAAIARLREQRAQGLAPPAVAHSATQPRPDPLVTFRPPAARARRAPRPAAPKPAASKHAAHSPGPRKPAARKPAARRLVVPQLAPVSHTASSTASADAAAPAPMPRKPRRPTAHQLKKQAAQRRAPADTSRSLPVARPRPRPRPRPAAPASESSSDLTVVHGGPAALVDAVKAMPLWGKLRRPRDDASDGSASRPADRSEEENAPSRFRLDVKRKWGDVVERLGGVQSAKGERFVLHPRNDPEPSDLAESNLDDRYFQELMQSEP